MDYIEVYFHFRRLAQSNYFCIGSMDGLYKNSYLIFKARPGYHYETIPKIICASAISDKKIQFNSANENTGEMARCIRNLDQSRLLKMKT